jgi:hypothetical protein
MTMGDQSQSQSQRVTGGCLCGAVRYEAEAFLQRAYYCHCRDCLKSTGQVVSTGVPVRTGSLRFTKGELKYYNSSEWGRRGFCADCGSRIVWRPRRAEDDWQTNLEAGSLDNPEDVRPRMHIFADRQLPWFEIDDSLPRARADEMERVNESWKQERLRDAEP